MKFFGRAAIITVILFILCGLIYPLAMTGVSQLLFPYQANGSMMRNNGQAIGSELLGQNFTDPRFFHGRVSAIHYNTYTQKDRLPNAEGKAAYTGVSSGSANLAPSNPALAERVREDIDAFLAANPTVRKGDIPSDLLTSSGSGLDPDISPEAARIQIPAISKATGLSSDDLNKIVKKYTADRTFGLLGERCFNILKANLEIFNRLKKS